MLSCSLEKHILEESYSSGTTAMASSTQLKLNFQSLPNQPRQKASSQGEAWPIPTSLVVKAVEIPSSILYDAKSRGQRPLLWSCKWGTARIEFAYKRNKEYFWRVYIEPASETRSA